MGLKNGSSNEKHIANMMSVGLFDQARACFRISMKDLDNCSNKIQNKADIVLHFAILQLVNVC